MKWDFDNDRAIYTQIIDHIKGFIISGRLMPGEKLMPVRELAAEAGVNPNTMQRALAELENTGLVYTNRTAGRFVTDDTKKIQQLREEAAAQRIDAFMADMSTLGFGREEVISLIKEHKGGNINEQ